MKWTPGKVMVVGGLSLIVVPPAGVCALWYYATHLAPRSDMGGYGDMIGFVVLPVAILAMVSGALSIVGGIVVLLLNRLGLLSQSSTRSRRDLLD